MAVFEGFWGFTSSFSWKCQPSWTLGFFLPVFWGNRTPPPWTPAALFFLPARTAGVFENQSFCVLFPGPFFLWQSTTAGMPGLSTSPSSDNVFEDDRQQRSACLHPMR